MTEAFPVDEIEALALEIEKIETTSTQQKRKTYKEFRLRNGHKIGYSSYDLKSRTELRSVVSAYRSEVLGSESLPDSTKAMKIMGPLRFKRSINDSARALYAFIDSSPDKCITANCIPQTFPWCAFLLRENSQSSPFY